ncbi:winged helix-turn-helix domain-containing protein [Paenibacillus sediminis]|uniref:DNA-binding transcriptional ArsR family regulator n=1 Tax=Paenibacillus sediminis TaxID=664909 RepID=A0ABS4GY71_9BACL|nr:winged helix-turn-helix domain-containing protein [Paenibacillus sediminis]MBP1935222.1 DNA-binding transcriptional ArsR family regulator [Paenibacillus sediminis]
MSYEVEVQFAPVHELLNSLHTYICRKSYKKTDLGVSWAKEVRNKITEEFASVLDHTEVNYDWKLVYLLLYLCPCNTEVETFLGWLEGLSAGEIYEMLSQYVNRFPDNVDEYRKRIHYLLSEWNKQYFQKWDRNMIDRLKQHAVQKQQEMNESPLMNFVDETTNGFHFVPIEGLERLIFIPQYHFQPANIIYHFGKVTICNYSSRIHEVNDDIPVMMHKAIRSLGEKSRLRILQYLYQEPKSFTEIVKHVGISKGIVHDHLFNLRTAGLIYAYIEGENVIGYSLRTQGIEQMYEQLLLYVNES